MSQTVQKKIYVINILYDSQNMLGKQVGTRSIVVESEMIGHGITVASDPLVSSLLSHLSGESHLDRLPQDHYKFK